MYIPSVQHLRVLQRFLTLPQNLPIISICRRYATKDFNFGRFSPDKGIRPIACYKPIVRCVSQQLNPKEEIEIRHKHDFESTMAKLESSYQWNGFIFYEHFQPLLDALNSVSDIKLTHEQGLFLLKLSGCGIPSLTADERLKNFQYIWQYLLQSEQITKEHYHIMLQVLEYNMAPLKDYKILLQEYEKHNGSSNEILPHLLAVAGSNGDVKKATEILAEMRALNVPLTEKEFASLLLAYARSKDMNGLQTIRESMQATGIALSTLTQSKFIVAYLENGDEIKASNLLQQFHGQFHPHEVLTMLQSIKVCSEISQDFISQLVKELPAEYVERLEVPISLRRTCVELFHSNKLDVAMCIISSLPTPNFPENQDVDTYGVFLMHAVFKAYDGKEKLIQIAKQLEDTNKNTRALYVAAEMALKRNPPLALNIFKVIAERNQSLRAHFFWPLMMYNFRKQNESGILRTLKIMQNFKVECDHQTIVEYVLPRLSITLTKPKLALEQLNDAGIRTSLVMTPLIAHMLKQNKWQDVAALVETYTTKLNALDLIPQLCSVSINVRATKKFHTFSRMLKALSDKNIDRTTDFVGQFLIDMLSTQDRIRSDLYCCQQLLNEMHRFCLSISAAAASRIQTLLGEQTGEFSESLKTLNPILREMTKKHLNLVQSDTEADSATTSTFIKHPRDMNIDELESHLVELEAKGMNNRGVLRRLLQMCVREDRLERALEIKNKCDKLNVDASPGMLASIFQMYTKLEDAASAENILKILKKTYPGFIIDEHKFVDYAALLVKCGQLENAKKILEERSLHHRIIGGDYLLKNVWTFLTNVAYLAAKTENFPKDRNLTRETFAYVQKLGYCKAHNAILGPIIRERLLRGDVGGAVTELKDLAQQYKHTPLQFELLSLVVRLSNGNEELIKKYNCSTDEAQKLLADITEIVTNVHGVINMNSGLLLAFAESGSDNQLRRLLITPEFCINEELLLRNCEHLGQEGSIQTLLRLARGARGLNRIINEENIYNMLLNKFIRANNYKAAIDLYERLEADDELKISQEFLRNLVQLLKVNNAEIPSNIALRAHIV